MEALRVRNLANDPDRRSSNAVTKGAVSPGRRKVDFVVTSVTALLENMFKCVLFVIWLFNISVTCQVCLRDASDQMIVHAIMLSWLAGWLLNVPATCECISGTDLHRQFYMLPH